MSKNSKSDALFEALFRVSVDDTASDIPKRKSTGPAPLSFSQSRIWFLQQLSLDSPAFNIIRAFHIGGSLNVPVFEACINEIIQRHDILRTIVKSADGQPMQIVVSPSTNLSDRSADWMRVPVYDLRNFPKEERYNALQKQITHESQTVFDLSKSPLIRPILFQLDENEFVFLLIVHHIVIDGWSMGILGRELAILYEAFLQGKPSPLEIPPIQYEDFAEWQQLTDQSELLEKQVQYWKKHFADKPPELILPFDQPPKIMQNYRGARHKFVFPLQQLLSLKSLSKDEGVTLFMTLLSAFQLLLQRYSGQTDICVGVPVAGRRYAKTKNLIGFFVNTLVMRSDLSGNPTFRELLGRVRNVAFGGYQHQDLPFEKLVEELHPERNLNRTPLFNVMFNLMNSSWHNWQLNGLDVRPLDIPEPMARFPLELYAIETMEGLHLDLVYQMDLFSSKRMKWMMTQLEDLLCQIVLYPDKPINEYSLFLQNSNELLPDPNMPIDEPNQWLVTERFLDWAERLPEQIAIRYGDQSWTYGNLLIHSQEVAELLLRKEIIKGDVVAVMGPRHPTVIAAMLGILMTGGILLPLDDQLPDKRKKVMLQQAKAKVIILSEKLLSSDTWLQSLSNLDIVALNEHDRGYSSHGDAMTLMQRKPVKILPEDPAYIFYTSGTTGTPKGVLGSHKGLSHFLDWQQKTFGIGSDDCVAQLTSLSFDPVLRDVFLPLTCGASICLPNDQDFSDIFNWVENNQVSVLHIVPTLAQSCLDNVRGDASLRRLRWVFMAGEPLADTLVHKWRSTFPQSGQIINLYGPTETTMAKCFFEVPDNILPGIQPVGYPIDQTQALVLSKSGRCCGIGEPGEIVIRTPFRSLGYINDMPADPGCFVQNPFSSGVSDRLYYTGDRGRFGPCGEIEFLGRMDDQVKIGGVRIEPSEVNAILCKHPEVRSAVVVTLRDKAERCFLSAYVVPRAPKKIAHLDLKAFLGEFLPAGIVPRSVTFLEQLPLTVNGKVDKRALPSPDTMQLHSDREASPPRTPIESELAAIWAGIFKMESVSIHDDFFELGGHSLLAIQLIAWIRRDFNVELSVREVFEKPTIAGLALSILERQIEQSDDDYMDYGTDPEV